MTQPEPSLFQAASYLAPLASPSSRAILDDAARRGGIDGDTQEAINELELAHLYCRGRIPRETPPPYLKFQLFNPENGLGLPLPTYRDPGVIDDARLQSFDGASGSVVLRLDTWQNPAFWAECHLPLDKLQRWLRAQGVDMQWRVIDGEEASIDV